ncbi:hypothetical protein [Candidatus Binatus sp.]|jgi:hypothetical protein|uniref:hypothetical protein n=1 Tax=Candidatus Binatus sp. TaxID=2811406 RepID=UPI003BBA0562
MSVLPDSIDLFNTLPAEAVAFFVFFSRFEFALKRTEYLTSDKKHRAKPNWERFANDLGQSFLNEVRASGEAVALLTRPPKKQIVRSDRLGWQDGKAITDAKKLFEAVRLVRNNLFHGGKFPDPAGFVSDVSRDRELLVQSQRVLEMALEKRPARRAPARFSRERIEHKSATHGRIKSLRCPQVEENARMCAVFSTFPQREPKSRTGWRMMQSGTNGSRRHFWSFCSQEVGLGQSSTDKPTLARLS